MDVQLGRQGLEKRAVSQDFELWLSNVGYWYNSHPFPFCYLVSSLSILIITI
jgi:hypothetical protein